MTSTLPHYEYDIFISYRHNDNRSDWVTHFIEHLKEELAATIKDPVSIYFDSNPHDGLNETHDVDDSLREKVKCRVFIPIVSRTYCQPGSFAWEKEFLTFLDFVKKDAAGLKIKGAHGNVNSRILPVRIHELDAEDVLLFEKVSEGRLRSVDFVFQALGVNRPLLPSDKKEDNQNKLYYRDQINKVANTVHDIIQGLKTVDQTSIPKAEQVATPGKSGQPKKDMLIKILAVVLPAVLLFSVYWYWSRTETNTNSDTRKSLAVIPFKVVSSGADDTYFADGLTDELINTLSGIPDLQVTGRTSSFHFKDKEVPIAEIAAALRVDHLVEGSVRRWGDSLRITVAFVRAKDGVNLWSHAYNEPSSNILSVQTNISENIAQALNILLDDLKVNQMRTLGVSNMDAFVAFQKGYLLFRAAHGSNHRDSILIEANAYFDQAIHLAPNFSQAYFLRSDLYGHLLLNTIDKTPELSEQEIMEISAEFRRSLENAIMYSRDKGSALIHKSDLLIFSGDWSPLSSLMEQIKNSGTCDRPNWIQNFFYLKSRIDPSVATFLEDRIDCDPLREENYQMAALGYLHAGNTDKALQIIDNRLNMPYLEGGNTISYFIKSLILNAQGKYEDAKQVMVLHESEREKIFEVARYAAIHGDSSVVIEILKKSSELSVADRIRLNAFIGNRKEANALAASIDDHVLGPQELLHIPRYCLCGAPFDIEATPNFRKRIEEADLPWPPIALIDYPLKDW